MIDWLKLQTGIATNAKVAAAGAHGALVFLAALIQHAKHGRGGRMPARRLSPATLRVEAVGLLGELPARKVGAALQRCVDAGLLRIDGDEAVVVGYGREDMPACVRCHNPNDDHRFATCSDCRSRRAKAEWAENVATSRDTSRPDRDMSNRTGQDRTGQSTTPTRLEAGGAELRSSETLIVDAVTARPSWPDDAGEFHDAMVGTLEAAGWLCTREFPVPDRGDGRAGRIDIRAERGGIVAMLELDRGAPRDKSLRKLEAVDADLRMVVLRSPAPAHRIGRVSVFGVATAPVVATRPAMVAPGRDEEPSRDRSAEDPADRPPDDAGATDPVVRLQDALTRSRYRSAMPAMRRRFELARAAARLAPTGLDPEQVLELSALAAERSSGDPGALLAHWLDGEPPRWREVLDERAAKGRQAAARSRVAATGEGEPLAAGSSLGGLLQAAAAGRQA